MTTTKDDAWTRAADALAGLPGGRGLNIAHEAVDRHVADGRGSHPALRVLAAPGSDAPPTVVTYADLAAATNRFANVLGELGVGAGEVVCSLLGRTPDVHVTALGAMKAGAVFCPLFSAFGPDPVAERVRRGAAAVLVTTAALYRRKIQPIEGSLPLRHILLVDDPPEDAPAGVAALSSLMAAADDSYRIAATDPESPALLHFTSGTTGNPKGAVHVHRAVVAHHATAAAALGLRPDDVFWCTADPGWVTGTSYGIIAPLTHGVTSVVDPAEFDAARWYATLERERVNVWYTAPTAIRMLMRAGDDLPRAHDLSALRVTASVGEPLAPDAVRWGERVFGRPILDNWWQTETGGIMIANRPGDDVAPGSMGRPLPGVRAAVVEVDDDHRPVIGPDGPTFAPDGVDGELALRAGWPSMFRTYLGDPERYARCFAGDWYLSGDLARRDPDGRFWFVGRADDVVKTAGHLVGPFEVESVLAEHPAVAEAGVIGLPDPVAGNRLEAYVVLAAGAEPTDETVRDILGFGRRRLGAIAPRAVHVVDDLPHTRSGKVMRRLLRARALGLDEGDLSGLGT